MRPTPSEAPRRSLLRHAVASAASATLDALAPTVDPLRGVEHLIVLPLVGRSHDALLGPGAAGRIPTGSTDEVMTAPAADDPEAASRCFAPSMLPVLTRLASSFARFDAWYADGTDPAVRAVRAARAAAVPWTVFYPDDQGASVIALEHPEFVDEPGGFAPMSAFFRRSGEGTLPRVSVIEPRSLFAPADLATFRQTGRERSPDIRHAEKLVHQVYSALRAAAPDAALLVVATDGAGSIDARDRFEADGTRRTRVPAVLISAFARTGVVVTDPADHALVTALIRGSRHPAITAALDPSSYRPTANWPRTAPAWTPEAVPGDRSPDRRLRRAVELAAAMLGARVETPPDEAGAIALVRAAGARVHPQ